MNRLARGVGWAFLACGIATAAWAASSAVERCAANARSGDVKSCLDAAEQRPDDLAVRRNLALSLLFIGNYEEAINLYRSIVMARPGDAGAQYDLASALGFIRMYADAVEPIEAAIRLRPDRVEAYRFAAIVYMNLDRKSDAAKATIKSAELGEITSMYDLVQFYRDGVGVDVDPKKALFWARRAADAGHIGAMALMIRDYLEGLYGEAPDEGKAAQWAARERHARLGER